MRATSSCILIAFLVLTACSNKHKVSEPIAINEMKTIMWDLENADTWFNQISIIDSAHKNRKMNIQLYEQVFVSHKITKQQFYDSYQYYQTRPDQMKILIDSVVAYGERVRTSYKGARKY